MKNIKSEVEVSFQELNDKTFYQYSIYNVIGDFQLAGDTSIGKLKISGGRIIARTKEIYLEIIISKIKDAYQEKNVVYIKTDKGIVFSFHLDK